MKLLLDTHVLLWMFGASNRLSPKAREIIVDPANDVLASMVSLWEIAIKIRTGKLTADLARIEAAIEAHKLSRLGVETEHLHALLSLPLHHRDPFDHLLIAQAVAEGAAIMTIDRKIQSYPLEVLRAD